jgi:hypothetical protein
MSFEASFAVVTWAFLLFFAMAFGALVAQHYRLATAFRAFSQVTAPDALQTESTALRGLINHARADDMSEDAGPFAIIFASGRCSSCLSLALGVDKSKDLSTRTIFAFEGDVPDQFETMRSVGFQARAFEAAAVAVLPHVVVANHDGRPLLRANPSSASELAELLRPTRQ